MKYVDLNSLDSTFEVDPIYFWSCAHQILLVSTSHPNFAQPTIEKKMQSCFQRAGLTEHTVKFAMKAPSSHRLMS